MPKPSPEQEDQITATLIEIEAAERIETLRTEAEEVIKRTLGCSVNDAAVILRDLEERQRIVADLTPVGGALDQRDRMPRARLKWSRPD